MGDQAPDADSKTIQPGEATERDLVQLKQLVLYHYILAGLTVVMSCTPVVYIFTGLAMMRGDSALPGLEDFPLQRELGQLFVVLAGCMILLGWVHASVIFVMGRWVAQRRRHALLLVISGMNCMYFPFGTLVSIWAIIVLSRPRVGILFGRTS